MAFLIITNYAPDYKSAFHEIKTGINHFNSFHKEKLTVGYHETITRFVSFPYLFYIVFYFDCYLVV